MPRYEAFFFVKLKAKIHRFLLNNTNNNLV